MVLCIPLRLISKTRGKVRVIRPSLIYPYRSDGSVSFALTITVNLTIHIPNYPFIISIIPSYPAKTVFIRSKYDIPRCAPLMIFLGQCDFQMSFLGKNMPGNVFNRLSGNFVVDTRSY